MSTNLCPVLIIGSGPAGYSAAIYAARAMLAPVLITGWQQGGQLTITTDVENYPGFALPIQGPWLVEEMAKQAQNVGTNLIHDTIVHVDLTVRPFVARGDSGTIYTASSLIIATGAQAKWLGLESEKHFMGGGVSACATCDGFFFKGKDVVVVGGGNTAIEEALYLSHLARHVTLIHRRDTLRAEKIMVNRLIGRDNVHILWNTVVEEIVGTLPKPPMGGIVTGVQTRNVKTKETALIATDGVFVAIGHAPATDLFAGQLQFKPGNYIWTQPDSTKTSVEGVFAAGDVTDDIFRQAVTAAGRGCMAALEVEKFLSIENTEQQAAE